MLQTVRPYRVFEQLKRDREVRYHIPEVRGTTSLTIRSIETLLMIAAIRILDIRSVLELGTAYGYNAMHLATNTEASIITVDISQRADPVWKGTGREDRICAREQDIYDTAAVAAPADMVFCDINYSEESTKRCTDIAFQASPRVVVWHDFRNPESPHVETLLQEIATTRDLIHVEDSWLVFWSADGGLIG